MKTLLIVLLVAGAFTALAQSTPVATNAPLVVATTTNAPSTLTATDAATEAAAREASRTLTVPKTATQIKLERATMGGAAVQAFKSKKPWNLINPFAPLSAGDGTNNLVPNSAGGPPGLSIWSCSK